MRDSAVIAKKVVETDTGTYSVTIEAPVEVVEGQFWGCRTTVTRPDGEVTELDSRSDSSYGAVIQASALGSMSLAAHAAHISDENFFRQHGLLFTTKSSRGDTVYQYVDRAPD